MSLHMRLVFGFVALNAFIGAFSLLFFPARTDTLFFWRIMPPLSAALFGALYLAGAVVVSLVVWRGLWEPARYLVPILVTAGILLTVTTFLHIDRFIPGVRLAYWLLVYISAPLLALLFYVQHERRGATWAVTQPVTAAARLVAVATGGIVLLGSLLALFRPSLVVAAWPWPLSPLMARVFAAWFGAFAAGLLWFLWEREWGRLYQVANLMIASAVLDLVMAWLHRRDLTDTGAAFWLFCAHLAAFGLVGVWLHWRQYKAAATRQAGYVGGD
jgi:hypothetical protein